MAGNKTMLSTIVRGLYVVAMAGLPFLELCPLSTYSFMVLGVVLLFTRKLSWRRKAYPAVCWLLFAYYLLQVAGYLFHPSVATGFALEQKAGLLFLPLLIISVFDYSEDTALWGWSALIAGTGVAVVVCFLFAVFHFFQSGLTSVFFYHSFSAPLRINAIYLSLYVLIALLATGWWWQRCRLRYRGVLAIMSLLLGAALLLLSSKMIIAGAVVAALGIAVCTMSGWKKIALFVLTLIVVLLTFLTSNPLRQRYEQMNIQQARAAWHSSDFTNFPFDDLSLRVALIRVGLEVMNSEKSWVMGNGGSDYHRLVNERMKCYGFFGGNAQTGDTGYINYDMHNQYFESLIQYGVIGFVLLFTILATSLLVAYINPTNLLFLSTLVFSFLSLSESLLETQSGLLLFTLTLVYGWKFTRLKHLQKGASLLRWQA